MEEKAGTDFMFKLWRSEEARAIQNGDTKRLAYIREGIQNTVREAKEYADFIARLNGRSAPTAPPVPVLQGGIRRSTQGLHTPTMAEIVANANKPDPTAPYFDTNSDFMRKIDPLAPHYTHGDFPTLVNPLKPGPKMPSNG